MIFLWFIDSSLQETNLGEIVALDLCVSIQFPNGRTQWIQLIFTHHRTIWLKMTNNGFKKIRLLKFTVFLKALIDSQGNYITTRLFVSRAFLQTALLLIYLLNCFRKSLWDSSTSKCFELGIWNLYILFFPLVHLYLYYFLL